MRNLGRIAVHFSSTPLLSAGFAGLAFVAACSSAPADSSSGAHDELTINPIGSENEAHLVLQLPTDACLPGSTCTKELGLTPTIFVDGYPVALGASTRLKPGAHALAINSIGASVTLAAKQTLTLTVPVVHRVCTDAALPNLPHTDFGSNVSVTNPACPSTATGPTAGVPYTTALLYWNSGCTSSYEGIGAFSNPAQLCQSLGSYYAGTPFSYYLNGACVTTPALGATGCSQAVSAMLPVLQLTPGSTALSDAYEATVPGTLSVTVPGTTTAQTVTVASGDEADFPISLPAIGTVPAIFGTAVTFFDARNNPDAAPGTITSSCAGERSYTIPSATGTPAPLALEAFVNPACTYTLTVGGRQTVLDQTAGTAIGLHRLDVNDVTITREDGTTYTTKGTYSLNYGGVQVQGPFTTGTGIDVLSGTYQFSLSYTDFDGPQTQTQTITF
jgi:hypothetical protein